MSGPPRREGMIDIVVEERFQVVDSVLFASRACVSRSNNVHADGPSLIGRCEEGQARRYV